MNFVAEGTRLVECVAIDQINGVKSHSHEIIVDFIREIHWFGREAVTRQYMRFTDSKFCGTFSRYARRRSRLSRGLGRSRRHM